MRTELDDPTRNDPLHVAYLCRWSAEHWREDNTQPRDLDGLLERAAETLDMTVPRTWYFIAVGQALLMLAFGVIGGLYYHG